MTHKGGDRLRLAAEGFTAARLAEKLCRTGEAAHLISKVSVPLVTNLVTNSAGHEFGEDSRLRAQVAGG